MRLCTTTLLASVLLLASVAPARAGMVTFNFTGSIEQKLGSVLGITSPIGTPVSGSFSYNTSTKGSFQTTGNELIGTYDQSIPAGLHVQIGTVSVSSSNYLVQVQSSTNPSGIDELILVSQDILSVKGGTPDPQVVFRLDFRDFGPKVFQNASLPLSLDLNRFTPNQNDGLISNPSVYASPFTDFLINSLNQTTTTTTPEPATLILLGIGLAWLLSITVLGTLQVWLKRRSAA